MSVADDLYWLHLHLAWGADEALDPEPLDRLARSSPPPVPAPRPEISGSAQHLDTPGSMPRPDTSGAPDPDRSAAMPRPDGSAATPRPDRPAAAPRSNAATATALANEAETLTSLEAAVAGFGLCALRDTAGGLAFGDGPADAAIVLVIDAPSAEDDATGIPLSGSLGAFFGEVLASVGLRRDAMRVATLVPWRPPGDRPANASEIACCLPFLLAHLRLVRPSLVLVAGTAAAKMLTGGQGSARALLGTFRTIAIEGAGCDPIPALILPAPGSLQAETRLRRTTWEALLALRIRLDDDAASTITST